MNSEQLSEVYRANYDRAKDGTENEGAERISCAIFVLAVAVTEAARILAEAIKQKSERGLSLEGE